MEAEILTAQLNSMYEDEFFQTLWTLWQTRPETPLRAQAMTAVRRIMSFNSASYDICTLNPANRIA